MELCGVCFFVLFFFFKQKTAYEMRISDWSSDVCSSDLPRRRQSMIHALRHGARRAMLCSTALFVALAVSAPARAGGSSMPWEAPLQSILDSKIGRASCRERVCQYV